MVDLQRMWVSPKPYLGPQQSSPRVMVNWEARPQQQNSVASKLDLARRLDNLMKDGEDQTRFKKVRHLAVDDLSTN